jgi:hypothetical protein
MLQNKDYLARFDEILTPSANCDRHRVVFLREIKWQPNIPKLFKNFITAASLIMKGHGHSLKGFCKHPCVTREGTINKHYMEKHQLKWWSIERLKDVVKHKGRHRNNVFRKSFLSMLMKIIEHLNDTSHVEKTT